MLALRAALPLLLPLLAAVSAEEDCHAAGVDETSALQLEGAALTRAPKHGAFKPTRSPMRKLRRRQPHRDTSGQDNSGKLEGAAFADYSAEVVVDGQTFEAIVDTGSSVFAIAAHAGEGCKRYYTGRCTSKPISMQYGSGDWKGHVCNGVDVTLAGMRAGQPNFGGITAQTNFLTDCTRGEDGIVSQGIVGMGYPALTMGYDMEPLFDSVVRTTGVPNVFSMQCCGWTGGEAARGAITLGGTDPTLYSGELQYTPVTRELYFCVEMLRVSTSASPFEAVKTHAGESCERIEGATCLLWGCHRSRGHGVKCIDGLCMCPVGVCAHNGRCDESLLQANATRRPAATRGGAGAGGRLEELGALLPREEGRYSRFEGARSEGNCDTIVDSGTSELVLHTDLYLEIMAPIQEAANALPSYIPCISPRELSYFPDIILTFEGGVTLNVPPTTYFQPKEGSECMVLFVGTADGAPNIIGQPAMEAYYTVFDKDRARVGFAPIAGCR